MPNPICDNCKKPISDAVHPYTMKIELFPSIEKSLDLVASDSEVDFEEEIREIIAQLESMDEREREEEESKVYTRFEYLLCTPCRDSFARRLKRSIESM